MDIDSAPEWMKDVSAKEDLFTRALQLHKSTPNVSLAVYAQGKRVELGKQLLAKTRLYLDTNHWINLAEVHLGRPDRKIYVELYNLLSELVAVGKVLCPLGHSNMMELFKQTDIKTRIATAQTFDRFSHGCMIHYPTELMRLEVVDFIVRTAYPQLHKRLIPIEHSIWTKAIFYVGEFSFSSKTVSAELELALQKVFDDLFWSLTVEEWVLAQSTHGDAPRSREVEHVAELNIGKREHAHEFKTFDEVFLQEIRGTLDATQEILEQAVKDVFLMQTGRCVGDAERYPEVARQFAGALFAVFKEGKVTTQLPNFNIRAGIHAAMRNDRNRKYKMGDFDDLIHAATALPYFNYFVTEKSLQHLLSSSPLKYEALYDCRVFSNAEALLEVLRRI